MSAKHVSIGRLVCLLLTVCLLAGALVSCSGQGDEIPDGYQYATCKGEYFRLFVPTQWTVNTESGVSGATISVLDRTSVSMVEVPFVLDMMLPAETEGDTTAESEAETVAESVTVSADSSDRTATLEDFLAAHLASVESMTEFTLEKNLDSTLGGKRAKDITYVASLAGVSYRYRQVLCKVEGRFYLFTYSSTAETFDQWLDTVDEILENVVFHSVPYEGGDEADAPDVDNIPAGMKVVSGSGDAYRVFAPESWIAVPGSAASQVYVSETDRSNVSTIAYVSGEAGFDTAAYWEMTEKNYRDGLDNFVLVATVEGETMGGRAAKVYEYTYSVGGVDYRARQVVCAYSDIIVSMTYTALPENYDTHLADAKAMQAALVFRAPIVG